MELAYAGLQQLCAPFLDRAERLPGPQRDALGTAFGLRDGDAPDRFLVGLAVLSLVSDVAEDRALVCIVDDAQWLDAASPQALAFVARRLGAESVGLVFAVREPGGERHFERLPELAVGGLDDRDAHELLATVLTGPLDERVRDRLVAETRGNPLALLELPHGWTPAELAGGFWLSDAPALSERIEQSFRERLAPLPPSTRLLLLVAAAEPLGDPVLVWRAAAELGIGPDAAAPAAAAGLVDLGAQVRFGHPIVRSAVKRAAAPEERQRIHRALAEATDADIDPDRRAWHRAHATVGLDEDVAAELERSADRARARGGLANWRGRDAEAEALMEARRQDVVRRGEGLFLAANDWGGAIRYNGLGRYEDALAAAERAVEAAGGLGPSDLLLAELIEAAARSGRADRASRPLAQLAEIARAAGTDWALGTHARAAAMLAEGETVERLYREAIERLSHVNTRPTLARTHLLYGEWLRRAHRRVDAREQLRVAYAMLSEMGMEAFAERARRELLATGETVRKRTVETLDELTPQEVQAARLAADGQTNPEIGAQLFLSPRTVEWHLTKLFGKLGISSRKQLRSALSDVGH